MKHPHRSNSGGFTLIEVLVSLGVFTFAVVVIVTSLGVSGRSAANDARRTMAVEILHTCFRDLDMVKTPGAGPSPTLGLTPVSWGSSPAAIRLWFDSNGHKVAVGKDAFFQCDLTPKRDAAGPLGHLHGRIVWPAKRAKGAPDGDVELFTSLLLP